MEKELKPFAKNPVKYSLTFNLPEEEIIKRYNNFKHFAQEARKDEIEKVGIDPLSSLDKYKLAISEGWFLIKNRDIRKIKFLNYYSWWYYIKSQMVGFILGVIASLIASLIFKKYN